MSKEHDENKDLRLISRIAYVNYADKTIQANKSAIIGNTSWGRIDYLTHYCGWHFIWNNDIKPVHHSSTGEGDKPRFTKKDAKRTIKDNSLSNKRNRKER